MRRPQPYCDSQSCCSAGCQGALQPSSARRGGSGCGLIAGQPAVLESVILNCLRQKPASRLPLEEAPVQMMSTPPLQG